MPAPDWQYPDHKSSVTSPLGWGNGRRAKNGFFSRRGAMSHKLRGAMRFAQDRRRLIPLVIVVAGFWAYHNSFQGPFIFDDLISIRENPYVRHLWPISEAISAPRGCPVDGRPVVCLTFAINYALGGLNVWGYHAFNLVVHILNALLLFGIVRRTAESPGLRVRVGGQAPWFGLVVALVWLVHPLQTESVNYLVERTELLMGMFLLLTLYCVIRGSQSTNSNLWYCTAIAACALGMGSKEVMVVAPLIVVLYDRMFLTSSFRELWRQRGGTYAGLAATWLFLARLVAMTPRETTGFKLPSLNSWDYLKTEANVIVHYLRLCFWPHPLVIDYYDWPITRLQSDILGYGSVVVALIIVTLWALRRRAWLGFLGAWFFLILVPTSSILPSAGEVAAERRMYLPLAAVVTLVVAAVHRVLREIVPNRRVGMLTRQNLGWALVIGILLTLGRATVRRNEDYRSAVSIWSDAVNKRPNNPRAHLHLGDGLMAEGNLEGAVGQYAEALRLLPNYGTVHIAMGVALGRLGRIHEAIDQFSQAIAMGQEPVTAYFNRGVALARRGRLEEAIRDFEAALQLDPSSELANAALNDTRQRMRRGDFVTQSVDRASPAPPAD
jgi:hypothetical protein